MKIKPDDLSVNEKELVKRAIQILPNAYAPYSKLSVGVALMDERGIIHEGVNVENISYPIGTCAEAGAISQMILSGSHKIKCLCVASLSAMFITPCGGCRQRILEFADGDTIILSVNENGLKSDGIYRYKMVELLPHAFDETQFQQL